MSVARSTVVRLPAIGRQPQRLRDNHEQCDCKRRSHRTERPAPAVGRLPGHSRGRHRLRHPRRHPGHLGRRLRLHRRATRRHRRRRPHRLLFRHHHRRSRRRQDRLRQADRRGVPVSRAVGLHHVCGDQGPGPGHRVHVSLPGHVRLRPGQRHARSRGQPARLHALSEEPHSLPQHPPRELASRPRARRSRRLDSRRRHGCQLEGAARPLPRADGALRPGVHGPAVPEVRGLGQGPQRRRDAEGRRHPRGARRVLPRRPLLQGSTRRHHGVLHRERVLRLDDVGPPRAGRSPSRCC